MKENIFTYKGPAGLLLMATAGGLLGQETDKLAVQVKKVEAVTKNPLRTIRLLTGAVTAESKHGHGWKRIYQSNLDALIRQPLI